MHVLGQKCPICGKKGLVIGADVGLSFRPQGWLVKRLSARQVACPHCGVIVVALLPDAVRKLKDALQSERATEIVTYHSRPRPRTRPPTP